jgi:ligand-binding sensor domain-containing protein
MKLYFTYLFFLILALASCSKEEEEKDSYTADYTDSKYVFKIMNSSEGYWIISRTVKNPECELCSSLSLVEGLAYISDGIYSGKDKLGVILDAEVSDDKLIAITPKEILSYDLSLQKEVLGVAEPSDTFKFMDKDAQDKIWILSGTKIFNLEGKKIPLPFNYNYIDFEVNKDSTFWIATDDSVFHVTSSKKIDRYDVNRIANQKVTLNVAYASNTIYNLSIDKKGNVWVNTNDKLYKFSQGIWTVVNPGSFVSGDFKTIPFMDVDEKGQLWVAERNYKQFTHLHCFNGVAWSSYKLDPPIDSYINDIESTESGYIWIGTDAGLIKLEIN